MSVKSPDLSIRLAAEIAERGPVSFARFMEAALYDPAEGYYASGRAAIGKAGDFFTNVSIGPVYGEILAGQFVEMWEALERPEDFVLVEQGASDGQLARDILEALAGTPLAGVPLMIVEPSEVLRERQRQKLAGRAVSWVGDAGDLPEICGVHYSNELFDAFPVHVVRSTGDRWMELCVDCGADGFVWRETEAEGDLAEVLAEFPRREKGFATEVCLSHRNLLHTLARKMRRGFLFAVDYGMAREELLAEHRTAGTLSCYRGHRRDGNPLETPGEKDLTAHVDFTFLAREAVRAGWKFENLADQHHFLVGAASAMLLAMDGRVPDPAGRKKLRALQTLLHPESMGRQFHALLFSKGVSPATLSGFQYARETGLFS